MRRAGVQLLQRLAREQQMQGQHSRRPRLQLCTPALLARAAVAVQVALGQVARPPARVPGRLLIKTKIKMAAVLRIVGWLVGWLLLLLHPTAA